MKIATDRLFVAQTIFAESRAMAKPPAAADIILNTARKARAIVILTMSALVPSCVGGTTASMTGTLLIVAGRELNFRVDK